MEEPAFAPALHETAPSVILSPVKSQPHPVSPARAAAFDILLRIDRESSYAPELLHSVTSNRLSTIDHSLLTELVMGVLRWRSLLDSEIAKASAQPLAKLDSEILTALRLALYQLRWLTRVPSRAAIHESVELVKRARKRSAAPFVNAVLRKLSATPAAPHTLDGTSLETLAASSAHPQWLVERWTASYGLDATLRICQHDQTIPATTIRLRRPEAAAQLEAEGIELAPGAFLASACRVLHGEITATTSFRSGLCAIQDEASQLVAALVGHGTRVLDCCAAPGGKTAALADANPQAEIVALDLHPHRARLLRKLIGHDSTANISVIAADARTLPFTHNSTASSPTPPAPAPALSLAIRKSNGVSLSPISATCKRAKSQSSAPPWRNSPPTAASSTQLVLWKKRKTKTSSKARWKRTHHFESSTAAPNWVD